MQCKQCRCRFDQNNLIVLTKDGTVVTASYRNAKLTAFGYSLNSLNLIKSVSCHCGHEILTNETIDLVKIARDKSDKNLAEWIRHRLSFVSATILNTLS